MADGSAHSTARLPLRYAYLVLFLVPAVAAAILIATLLFIRDESAGVAIPIGTAIGFVVVIAAAVTLSAVAREIRLEPTPEPGAETTTGDLQGLSTSQGAVLILSFVVLTAVPAAVVVGATRVLHRNVNLYYPEYALPVILIVGLIGLLAVLSMMVAIFRRFRLVSPEFPLGLPEGSIQAVIALSLILIFAIIGVYLHATAQGEQQDEISTQLLTTISTLVVAVAGFYFGSKTSKEAAAAANRAHGESSAPAAAKPPGPKPPAGGAAKPKDEPGKPKDEPGRPGPRPQRPA